MNQFLFRRVLVRVGIIAFNNLRYCPYLRFYTDLLDKFNIGFEVIYLKRDPISNSEEVACHSMTWKRVRLHSKVEKLLNFALFRSFVLKKIRENNYDFVIILTSIPAVLIINTLTKDFPNRYILDIRDYTHEKNRFFYYLQKKAIEHSLLNVISSPGFRKFLPYAEYRICHNLSFGKESMNRRFRFSKRTSGELVVGYVGSIAYVDQCIKFAKLVSKDSRFAFHLYGNEIQGERLSKYLRRNHPRGVRYFGPYEPSMKPQIYDSVDILFNAYGSSSLLLKTAISNKYYEGLYYKKPLLTSPDTIMAELLGGFSYSIDFDYEKTLDGLYEWYISIPNEDYDKFADETLESAISDNENLGIKIYKLLKGSHKIA